MGKKNIFFCLLLLSFGLNAAADETPEQKAEALFNLLDAKKNLFEEQLKKMDDAAFYLFFKKVQSENKDVPGMKKSLFLSLWAPYGYSSYDQFRDYYLTEYRSVSSDPVAPPLPQRPPPLPQRPSAGASSSSSSVPSVGLSKPAQNQVLYEAHLVEGFRLLVERKKMDLWVGGKAIRSIKELIIEMNEIGARWFGKAPAGSRAPKAPASTSTSAPAPATSEPKGKEEDLGDPGEGGEWEAGTLVEDSSTWTSATDIFDIDDDAFTRFLAANK